MNYTVNLTNASSTYLPISSETEFAVKKIIIPFLSVTGILGNVLSVSVFLQKTLRSQFTTILCALGFADILFLAGRFLIFGIFGSEDLSPIYIPSITYCAQTAATFLTVAISWERHTAICHPLHSHRLLTESKTWKAILAIVLFACAINIPEIYKTVVNGSEKWLIVAWTTWDSVMKVFVPLLLIGYLNIRIFIEIKVLAKFNRELGKVTTDSNKSSKQNVLLAVVLVFAFCYLPFVAYFIQSVVEYFPLSNEEALHYKQSRFAEYLILWVKLSTTLNSSVNFIIYFAIGTKFRHQLKLSFRKLFKLKPERVTSSSMTSI